MIENEQLKESKNRFNPSHIRPSSAGSGCLRQEVYRILNALYPEEAEYIPPNPNGKDGIKGMARIGDIVEEEALNRTRESLNRLNKRVFPQYELPSPRGLKNPDGSIVVAHPDIYVPSLNYDIEIKCVGTASIPRLPNQSHVEQLLLRLLWWKRSKDKKLTGVLTYFFRETYYAPGTLEPIRFVIEPIVGGFNVKDESGKILETHTINYVEEIEERLHTIAKCVETLTLPERTESHNVFPCYVHGKDSVTECPWREKCWAKELEEERSPGALVEKAEDIVTKLSEAKEKQKALDKKAREAKKEVKALQEELTPVFDEFGDKITAGGHTVSRTLVNIPEKTMRGYSYYRYSMRKQK